MSARFNSGEYSGAKKRRGDTDGGSVVDVRDQATRILVAAMTQFDQDPMQAVRAVRQQAATLKGLAVRTADAKLAIAAAALESYLASGTPSKAGLAQPVGAILSLNPSTQAPAQQAG